MAAVARAPAPPSSAPTTALLLLLGSALRLPALVGAKDAFVFLGATGDNALRPSGVWQGVYEAFAGGDFDQVGGVGVHVAMNTPHTEEELRSKVLASISPLYEELKQNRGWSCRIKDGDCSPARFMSDISVNIWPGRDAGAQAANMTPSLLEYERVTVYLSVPPSVFGSWSQAAVEQWGQGPKHRVHVALEKPFGSSVEESVQLHREIMDAGVREDNVHLVDHWLSFFMNRNLPELRDILAPRLGISTWGRRGGIGKVVVTEFEERGLQGRGGFFDGVGQVRDMVQSHLLQVLALALLDPADGRKNLRAAKLAVLNRTSITRCQLGQYDGFLLEPKLGFHPSTADATFCEVSLRVDSPEWSGVPVVIATGKSMGSTQYTVEYFQRDGPGVLTFEIGKEETGIGGARVQNWRVVDSSPLLVPGPGFDASSAPVTMRPAVSSEGNGYIISYSDPEMYFPKPYALMAASLLTRDYDRAFVAYAACERSWSVVTSSSPSHFLDPPPAHVQVYEAPSACGQTPPFVCWRNDTVEDLYNKTFKCSVVHDRRYANVSFYQAKCHAPPPVAFMPRPELIVV